VIGRLRPGKSTALAQAEMDTITRQLAELDPNTNRTIGANVQTLVDAMVGKVRLGLWILLGVVGLVLLIACTNVANLMLGRSASRRKELAVRAALGAGRGRLARQLLTESMMLALAGGILGLALSSVTRKLLVSLLSDQFHIPRVGSTHTDAGVLAFTLLLLTGACGMVIGARGLPSPQLFVATMLGLALACGGASALNHVLDADIDRLMGKRTEKRPVAAGRIEPGRALEFGLTLSAFSFVLQNAGNVSFRPVRLVARAHGPGGALISEKSWPGWYVLAGGARAYAIEVPTGDCAQVRRLEVDADLGGGRTLSSALEAPDGACAR